MTRIRLIVLDGLDWPWCREHADDCAELWTIAEEGCCAPLRACTSPVTPMGAAAVLTGREMDIDWKRSPNGDAFASSQDLIRARPWSADLARHGLTLGLCNVPLTWPAFALPGLRWMTSGYPVQQAASWHHPRGLDVFGYPVEALSCGGGVVLARDLNRQAKVDGEIVDWFLSRPERCDVEVIWLMLTDAAAHRGWGTPAYRDVVRAALALLPRLREGAETCLVLSDHGADALTSPRCAAYMSSDHGPAATAMGLTGGHSMDGVLVAAGDRIQTRGLLPEQRLVEVAGGLFALLGLPLPPGLRGGASWTGGAMFGA